MMLTVANVGMKFEIREAELSLDSALTKSLRSSVNMTHDNARFYLQ